uniref:Uncharacterized protein n=1 Tax=Brugia timori TaxID=42155 RepID=A0A0R3QU47_9BILA
MLPLSFFLSTSYSLLLLLKYCSTVTVQIRWIPKVFEVYYFSHLLKKLWASV